MVGDEKEVRKSLNQLNVQSDDVCTLQVSRWDTAVVAVVRRPALTVAQRPPLGPPRAPERQQRKRPPTPPTLRVDPRRERREIESERWEGGVWRGSKGAKRQTRCVFCLGLNGAERKGVGVRRRACEEDGEQKGGASGSEWIFSFLLRGETL